VGAGRGRRGRGGGGGRHLLRRRRQARRGLPARREAEVVVAARRARRAALDLADDALEPVAHLLLRLASRLVQPRLHHRALRARLRHPRAVAARGAGPGAVGGGDVPRRRQLRLLVGRGGKQRVGAAVSEGEGSRMEAALARDNVAPRGGVEGANNGEGAAQRACSRPSWCVMASTPSPPSPMPSPSSSTAAHLRQRGVCSAVVCSVATRWPSDSPRRSEASGSGSGHVEHLVVHQREDAQLWGGLSRASEATASLQATEAVPWVT
jgi:hypothetical protein